MLASWAFSSSPDRVMFSVKKVDLAQSTVVLEPMQNPRFTGTWISELKDVPAEHQIWHCSPSVVTEDNGSRAIKLECLNEQGRELGTILVRKITFTKEMK